MADSLFEEGYQRAVLALSAAQTEHGFLATTTRRSNYRRIWGRDSAITGLAALLTGDEGLVRGCRQSLETLAHYQGPQGEIPSNVDPETGRVSYGGTTGRVDAGLWFAIACGEYWQHTGDEAFLKRMIEPLERLRRLLRAWEFNTRGLLYVPPTGDWADEYVHSGYVLYDELLYLQAQRELAVCHKHLHSTTDHDLEDRISRLKHLIASNYWFFDGDELPDDVYHEILYEKGRRAAPRSEGAYWMPFFSPLGYGYRFDAMANVFVSLLGVADDRQRRAVDEYIEETILPRDVMLLPAFHPVIKPKDEDWNDLQMTFSHTFKNAPHEYHNGGLWPLVTGFYVADLAARGREDLARRYLQGIHRANRAEYEGQPWSFPEYLHGQTFAPGGTSPMSWSAAAAIIGHQALEGKQLFRTLASDPRGLSSAADEDQSGA